MGDIVFLNMLTGKMVRSPYTSAEILSIDISETEKLLDAKCILTARDFRWKSLVGNGEFTAGFVDEEVLCSEKVHQVGDDVATVAAVDEEAA